ncbi:MAG: hypothetical protein Q9219_005199 [cf. Caloplaca sp. 3 TL-2023]
MKPGEGPSEMHHEDPMDLTPPSAAMGPPNSSPEMDPTSNATNGTYGEALHGYNGPISNGLSAAAATSSQQPKVVQTAFIHKLYNMLEDSSIQNLISWSNNNESFVMSPSADFSKVLAQYFKHTNISSFVRQLNMYGFHKVSDVFHTGSPDSALWEFKHGNGNFRRGDLAGLREIKRRASRHAMIHRDSFSASHKPSVSQPGTPAEPVPELSSEARIANLEHSLYELHARLVRTEESNTVLSSKCQFLSDGVTKCQQWSHDLSHFLISMIPDQDNPIRRDVSTMRQDISRQLEMMRHFDDPHESLLSGRQPHFSNMALDTPLSPRQVSNEERRPSYQGIPPRSNLFRPPVPAHFNTSPRRYGSIGTANAPLPNYHRPRVFHHPLAQIWVDGIHLQIFEFLAGLVTKVPCPQQHLASLHRIGPHLLIRHLPLAINMYGIPLRHTNSAHLANLSAQHKSRHLSPLTQLHRHSAATVAGRLEGYQSSHQDTWTLPHKPGDQAWPATYILCLIRQKLQNEMMKIL